MYYICNIFVIYGSKYKPKISRTYKICIDYRRKEDERRKGDEFLFIFFYFINIYFKLTLVILQLHSHEL